MATYTPDEFADALLASLPKAVKETVAVARKGALNVKSDAVRNVRTSAPVHSAHAYTAITFDVEARGTDVVAEIGYDKEKDQAAGRRTGPGGLGNILEYGSANNPAHRDLGRALDVEEKRFPDAMADIPERTLPE